MAKIVPDQTQKDELRRVNRLLDEVDSLNEALKDIPLKITAEGGDQKKSVVTDPELDKEAQKSIRNCLKKMREIRIREIRKRAEKCGIAFSDEELAIMQP